MELDTDSILFGFFKKRTKKIEEKSNVLVAEMIQHAESLREIRQASQRTQVDVAKKTYKAFFPDSVCE